MTFPWHWSVWSCQNRISYLSYKTSISHLLHISCTFLQYMWIKIHFERGNTPLFFNQYILTWSYTGHKANHQLQDIHDKTLFCLPGWFRYSGVCIVCWPLPVLNPFRVSSVFISKLKKHSLIKPRRIFWQIDNPPPLPLLSHLCVTELGHYWFQ